MRIGVKRMSISGHIQVVLLSIVTKFGTSERIYSTINTVCRLQCIYLILFSTRCTCSVTSEVRNKFPYKVSRSVTPSALEEMRLNSVPNVRLHAQAQKIGSGSDSTFQAVLSSFPPLRVLPFTHQMSIFGTYEQCRMYILGMRLVNVEL
jgi:hypothetical protein